MRGSRRILAGLGLLAILLTTGCAGGGPDPKTQTPPQGKGNATAECSLKEPPPEQLREPEGQKLSLTPSQREVRPGDRISITITGGLPAGANIVRGVDAYLECWSGSEWTPKYALTTGDQPTATPYPLPPNFAFISLGLMGPGPEPVQIPAAAAPGWYRIRKSFSLERGAANERHTLSAMLTIK